MDSKGQDALEYLFLFGTAIIVAAIIIAFIAGQKQPDFADSAENFCKAWAEERDFTYLDGYYKEYFVQSPILWCVYSVNTDTFDGGVSSGETEYKDFSISEEDLLKRVNKGKSKDCCEVCE